MTVDTFSVRETFIDDVGQHIYDKSISFQGVYRHKYILNIMYLVNRTCIDNINPNTFDLLEPNTIGLLSFQSTTTAVSKLKGLISCALL